MTKALAHHSEEIKAAWIQSSQSYVQSRADRSELKYACLLPVSFLYFHTQDPAQEMVPPTFPVNFPVSINPIKKILHRRACRPASSKQFFIETLSSDDSRLCEVDN